MREQLTVNLPEVVHETIDGETIVIHLGTGTYYSFDGVGADVWQLLVDGAPAEELVPALCARYTAEAEIVEAGVGGFLDELVQEGLLVTAAPDFSPSGQPQTWEQADGQFVQPLLHKYTDMQEFMLVDPLHDVEVDAGWPHVKAG